MLNSQNIILIFYDILIILAYATVIHYRTFFFPVRLTEEYSLFAQYLSSVAIV